MSIRHKIKMPLPRGGARWIQYYNTALEYDTTLKEEFEDLEEELKEIRSKILHYINARGRGPENANIYSFPKDGTPWKRSDLRGQTCHFELENEILKIRKIYNLMIHRHRIFEILRDDLQKLSENQKFNINKQHTRLITKSLELSEKEINFFKRTLLPITGQLPHLEKHNNELDKWLTKRIKNIYKLEKTENKLEKIEKKEIDRFKAGAPMAAAAA